MELNSNCVTNEVGYCPMCNSNNLDYEEIFINNGYVYFPYTCDDCGASGREEYYMDYCKHTNIHTKDGKYINNSMFDTEFDRTLGDEYDK